MPCTPPNAAERLVLADDRRNTVNSPFLMAGNSEDATLFIGSWTLLSYQLRLPSGAVEKPMGERPRGRILYLKNGQMSAQVTASGLDSLVNEDSRDATPEEAVHAWRNYIGYWGTYAVDAAAGLVIHSVEGAWFPNWVGQQQVRKYRFFGDRLILEASSPVWHATLVWQRID
jgi:hypothetical protein